ncbi:MAG: acetyl-CoA carboxylase biotin carboxyl carrier protein [Bacteroidales bacterium]|nr:acetyl-CoA carboxylase biotin carboxyl carrier protein [Lachnoclostridium sp.]MCM1384358.1 acetyl-CoA carboxylase biotin carboxyl carrier protein [Lachnoclostridium sp.]MCM1464939.1 acetyl-CoA carboxylase biotin carboxyl carrier protein [Bacteroidales bacterium]
MEFNQVLELVKVVSDSELTTFSYEEGNQKILMQTGNVVAAPAVEKEIGMMQKTAAAAHAEVQGGNTNSGINEENSVKASADANAGSGAEISAVPKEGGTLVKSPLVGRFYAAPSEDAEPFVKVGDTVKKGQVLAIVEAMKLMNEIESEYDGVVAEILAENGQGVEYGQALFRLQ